MIFRDFCSYDTAILSSAIIFKQFNTAFQKWRLCLPLIHHHERILPEIDPTYHLCIIYWNLRSSTSITTPTIISVMHSIIAASPSPRIISSGEISRKFPSAVPRFSPGIHDGFFPDFHRGAQGGDLHSEDGGAQGLHQQSGNLPAVKPWIEF